MTHQFDLTWMKELPVNSIQLKRPGGKKGVLVLKSSISVVEALTTLVSAEILSAPVWDEDAKVFIGNMDVFHIVNLISITLGDEKFEVSKLIENLDKEASFKKSIKEAFKFSSSNVFYGVKETSLLLDVAKEMVETGDKFHRRALIFNSDEKNVDTIVSMASQAAIISFIGANKNKLGTAINQPLTDFAKVDWEESRHKVVSISGTSNMIEAFGLMGKKSVSGLAVLDEHGQLMGTVGSRDVKGLVTRGRLDLSRLRLTVREYMNYIRQLSIDEKHPAISVKKSDSMATLIGKFASTHVHRIFVIDDHNSPIGVISTIDLMRMIINNSTF